MTEDASQAPPSNTPWIMDHRSAALAVRLITEDDVPRRVRVERVHHAGSLALYLDGHLLVTMHNMDGSGTALFRYADGMTDADKRAVDNIVGDAISAASKRIARANVDRSMALSEFRP